MEVVVEGEGRAGGHSEPVGVDEEPDGRTAEVPGGPEAVGGEEEERYEVIHEVVIVMKYMRTGT